MKNDKFSGKRRSRSNGKRCPDCGTLSCFPLRFFSDFVPNRFICECGRVVDRNGQRIRLRVLR
jgi:hypothetical protein